MGRLGVWGKGLKRCGGWPVLALLLACDDPFEADNARAYKSVATGGEHSCAVSEDGAAYCWGRGLDGELGIGVKENRATPARVAGNIVFDEITAGDSHTCGVAMDGTGYCWGWNAFFQRGNPDDPHDAEPVPLATQDRFSSISAGAHHTCALSVDSLAFCWGHNRYGQIGDGTTNTAIQPKRVQTSLKFVQLSSGAWHSCALTAGGGVFCWGRNEFGQLGIGSTVLLVVLPTAVTTPEPFAQIDAGSSHTCGVARAARLYCWGSSEYGELGDGGVFKPGLAAATTPSPVSSFFPTGTSISAGASHTCAVGAEGIGRCWGRGLYGQLANGSFANHFVPQPIYLQPEHLHMGDRFVITSFAAGGATHACALVDRSVYCWGTGSAGQLGVGGSTLTALPQRVAD